MPISSGAAGRVDVGVDTSIVWSPDRSKRETQPRVRCCDSYLKRYLESTQKLKHEHDSVGDSILPCEDKRDGRPIFENTQNARGSRRDLSNKLSSGKSSKKSKTCTLL